MMQASQNFILDTVNVATRVRTLDGFYEYDAM